MLPGFFPNEVQNLTTKPTETGDLVDYAEIPGFSGEIVKLRMIVEKKPGDLKPVENSVFQFLKTIASANAPRFLLQRSLQPDNEANSNRESGWLRWETLFF